uniref:non-specific protein-tyrosine kinase n=1 Tax=Solibacter usitatus (strain Ellin6076) TaxID=234267 RepID=Q01XL7_SOLUE
MNDHYEPESNGSGPHGLPVGPDVRMLPSPSDGWVPEPTKISYWKIAWGHKFILLLCIFAGALGGTAYVILKTPEYAAASTVELIGFNQSFMNMSQVDPQAGTDMTTASASNIQTQTRILTSRSMLARVAERMSLEMTPIASTPTTFFTKLRAHIPFAQKEPLEQMKEAVRTAAFTVSARGVGATRLIELRCQSPSPEVAANFLNTLAAEHISQNLAIRSSATQRTSQWMDSQMEEAKSRLQTAGEKLRDFVRQSGMDFFPEQSTLADSKMKVLQGDLAAIQADRIAKQARWEMAKNTPIDSLPDVLSDPTLLGLKSRIVDLRREMAQLTATLTPEHYKVQKIQAQISELQQTLDKEKTGLLKRLDNDYQEALRREKLLSGAYNAQTHAVGAQADKASQYAMLKRDAEMAQQVYNGLLQQANQAALIALVPASNIRVVDAAVADNIPSSPTPMRDIPTWSLFGGALCYGLLWFREVLRRKRLTQLFESPGHTRTILGVPELGVIPSATIDRPKKLAAAQRALNGATSIHPLGTLVEDGQKTLEFATWQNKSSILAESFRQTLTSILRAQPKGECPVYVITSGGPGEGKTTLSANLAIAMAMIGQRVLLIDADLRRARLHSVFGLDNCPGLSDLLTSTESLEEADLAPYLSPTKVDNLRVMTHGLAQVGTPATLFFSPRVKELVKKLRGQFDYILLDTAPVLLFPDARLWGRHSDGVVLVVRAGVTTREGATSACQRFAEDGIAVLGTILNDWTPKEGSPSHYYYHSYEAYGQK